VPPGALRRGQLISYSGARLSSSQGNFNTNHKRVEKLEVPKKWQSFYIHCIRLLIFPGSDHKRLVPAILVAASIWRFDTGRKK